MRLALTTTLVAGLLGPALPLAGQPAASGQVLARDGQPIAGARAELVPIPTGYQGGRERLEGRGPEPLAATTTDSLGHYFLSSAEPGLFAVRVSAPGRVPLSFDPLPLVEPAQLPPAVLPEDGGAALVIRDGAGRPAAGLWVLAEAEGEAPSLAGWRIAPRIGRTAADGSLTLPRLAAETLRVHIFSGAGREELREGFRGGEIRLGAGAPAERRLRILDPHGGPVAGVLVRSGEASWPVGLSDADGRLTMRAGPGRVRLASADGRQLVAHLAARDAESSLAEETLVLPEAPPLSGRVRQEETGRPLPGALVWPAGDPGAYARTDAEGRYQVPAPSGRGVWLEARAPGRLAGRILLEAPRSGAGRAPTLALERAAAVAGRVVGAGGAPIPDVWVSARRLGAAGEPQPTRLEPSAGGAATAADGAFRVGGLRPGETYLLDATKDGFLPVVVAAPAALSPGRPTGVVLVLAPTRPAVGRVLDPDGRPVAGAEVRLAAATSPAREGPPAPLASGTAESADALSAADGSFLVAAIPALALDAEVRRQGFAPSRVRGFKVPPVAAEAAGSPVDLGTIVLKPGAALAGQVIDGQGRPIARAQVFEVSELRPPAELAERLRQEVPAATTGPDGRFSLVDRPRGLPLHLLVSAPGYLPATVRGVRPPTLKPLSIRLTAGTALAGRVVDPEGLPVAGASIEASGRAALPGREDRLVGPAVLRRATAGQDGRFELPDLPEGRSTLTVSAAGFVALDDLEVDLPQPPGEEVRVVLARGATLEGRVLTTAGEPVTGARILAGPAACLSDGDGVFRTDGVPTGPLAVLTTHPHYPTFRRRMLIEEGVNSLEVVLPAGTTVRGRVLDTEGAPIAGATAALEAEPRGGGRAYRARTDAEGAFTLEPVAAGGYRLGASAEGFTGEEGEPVVIVGKEPIDGLEVVLGSAGTLSGQLLGLVADELAGVTVRGEHESGESRYADVDATGGYLLRSLRAGAWRLEGSLLDGQRQARARVLLAAGAKETRDLRFGGGLTLSGTVLYREAPLPEALVSLRGHHLAVERAATTDHEGGFRFEDLDADTYALGLAKPSELLAHNETIELAVDRHVTLRLERGAVAGMVEDAASEAPVADAIVALRHLAGESGPEFVIADASDASGAFRLERVPPGLYRLSVRHPGYAPLEGDLEVPADRDLTDLELPLDPAAGAELTVRCGAGAVPGLLHLRLLSPAGAPVLAESRPVGSDGKLRLSSAPAGSWLLLAANARCALGSVPLTVPGEPVTLQLPEAARLAVRVPALVTSDAIGSITVTAANGQPFQTLAAGGIVVQSWPLVAGRGTVEGLPAGAWVVTATTPDGRGWSAATVTDGRSDREVDLE